MEIKYSMERLAEEAVEHQRPSEEDFLGDDGLLYCGVCRKPKQIRFDEGFLSGRTLPCRCDCSIREEEEEKAKYLQERIRFRREKCFANKELWSWTFANDKGQQPKMEICRIYTEQWEKVKKEKIGLLLLGDVGCGKSYAACSIANAICEKDQSARFVNFSDVLNDLQNCQDRSGYIRSLTDVGLLVIDDFGAERDSKYAMEQLFNLVDSRYQKGGPLVVTTNLTMQDLKDPKDTDHRRIYDRVLSMCVPIHFKGESLRPNEGKTKLETLIDILRESSDEPPGSVSCSIATPVPEEGRRTGLLPCSPGPPGTGERRHGIKGVA